MAKNEVNFEFFRETLNQFLEESYKKSREMVLPWNKERDPRMWIEDVRHANATEAVVFYLQNTKGFHNLHLLRDTGRKLLRIFKDQEDDGSRGEWWGQGSGFYADVITQVAFYLIFGCYANQMQTEHVIKSLGMHTKYAVPLISYAREHFRHEYGSDIPI